MFDVHVQNNLTIFKIFVATNKGENTSLLVVMTEWLKVVDCKSTGGPYVGSNPTRYKIIYIYIAQTFSTYNKC